MQRSYSMPSTSKTVSIVNSTNNKILRSPIYISQYNTQKKETQNIKNISNVVSADYKEFEDKLINKQEYNSTFKLDENFIVPGNVTGHHRINL